jgi:hypothetical protein
MRSHLRLLSLVASATVGLLAIGAFLVVLGIFGDLLDWDIFSPATERFLYGIFGSCIAVGGFGAAISVVLGPRRLSARSAAWIQGNQRESFREYEATEAARSQAGRR